MGACIRTFGTCSDRSAAGLTFTSRPLHADSGSSFGDSIFAFRLENENVLSPNGVTTWSHQPCDLDVALSGEMPSPLPEV